MIQRCVVSFMCVLNSHAIKLECVVLLESLTGLWSLELTVSWSCYTYSLLGSFVPFGGFFIPPSDLKNPVSITQESTHRHLCNKYEQEMTSFLKDGSTRSVAGRHQESLPSWLQTAEYDKSKGLDVTQVCNPIGL